MFTDILIKPLDTVAMERCQLRLDNLTKPLNSLLEFEILARKMAGITRNPRPRSFKSSIVVMAADHGCASEMNISNPQAATAEMVKSFAAGTAAVNIFAGHTGAKPLLVDIGTASELAGLPSVHSQKICSGTNNMAMEPAMTGEQVEQAINLGIDIARRKITDGIQVIGLGQIGMGVTAASTAITSCYSRLPLSELIKQHSSDTEEMLQNKYRLVKMALDINQPDPGQPLDVLRKVGGLDIAGLTGVILGAAQGGAAIVLDGAATSAAALIAVKLAPGVKDYLIGSHFSLEPAHKEALDIIGIPAYYHLNMRLGDGTGAALGISLIKASLHVLNDMKTFGEAEVAVAQDGPGALKQTKDVKD